jgi:hypothetical protein
MFFCFYLWSFSFFFFFSLFFLNFLLPLGVKMNYQDPNESEQEQSYDEDSSLVESNSQSTSSSEDRHNTDMTLALYGPLPDHMNLSDEYSYGPEEEEEEGFDVEEFSGQEGDFSSENSFNIVLPTRGADAPIIVAAPYAPPAHEEEDEPLEPMDLEEEEENPFFLEEENDLPLPLPVPVHQGQPALLPHQVLKDWESNTQHHVAMLVRVLYGLNIYKHREKDQYQIQKLVKLQLQHMLHTWCDLLITYFRVPVQTLQELVNAGVNNGLRGVRTMPCVKNQGWDDIQNFHIDVEYFLTL